MTYNLPLVPFGVMLPTSNIATPCERLDASFISVASTHLFVLANSINSRRFSVEETEWILKFLNSTAPDSTSPILT